MGSGLRPDRFPPIASANGASDVGGSAAIGGCPSQLLVNGAMTDQELNPYAPPASGSQDPPAYRGGDPDDDRGIRPRDGIDYEAERQSVVLCILLTAVTCGLYPIYWLFKRKPFLDSLRSNETLGQLPVIFSVTTVVALVGAFVFAGESFGSLLSAANGIAGIVTFFRVRAILEQERIAMGAPGRLSAAATFFFSIYYLQYRINLLADVARNAAPPRPKKKKKKRAQLAA